MRACRISSCCCATCSFNAANVFCLTLCPWLWPPAVSRRRSRRHRATRFHCWTTICEGEAKQGRTRSAARWSAADEITVLKW